MKLKLSILCLLLFCVAPLHSAIYMKIDDIEGESTVVDHEREIVVQSYSMGMVNTPVAGGGGGAGKVSFHDFHFAKRIDKSSPLLMMRCATGAPVRRAVISVTRNRGEGEETYLTITLENVLVSSYSTAHSSGPDYPMEEIAMSFTKITYEYTPQKPDGTNDESVKFTWDLAAGTAE